MDFSGEDKNTILNLIAILAIRSPEMRERTRGFQAELVHKMMSLSLETEERWQEQIEQMRNDGHEVDDDVSYESIKAFHESKEYKIELAREWHIHLEFAGIDAILPCLFGRKWMLIRPIASAGPLITSDRPVLLSWNDPDSIPPLFRNSPGYALTGTNVYFPLSQSLAIIGEFEREECIIDADDQLVAHLNSLMLQTTYAQLYTPKLSFKFVGKDGQLLEGKKIAEHLNNK